MASPAGMTLAPAWPSLQPAPEGFGVEKFGIWESGKLAISVLQLTPQEFITFHLEY